MQYFNQPILPEAMMGLALGLIALIIAIAILLVEKGATFKFDRIVIVEKIIRGKTFIFFLSLLFVPLFFWDVSDTFIRFMLFILYGVGVYGFIALSYRSYKWIKEIESQEKRLHEGYRQKMRLNYFEDISDDPQKILAWEYIWQMEDKPPTEEITYMERFTQNIDSLWERNNMNTITQHLTSFEKFVDNISIHDWVVFETIFNSLLKWHFKLYASIEVNKGNKIQLKHLMIVLERIIKRLVERSLLSGSAYIFFESLNSHLSKEKEVTSKKKYLRQLWSIIAPTFFEHISDSPERRNVWLSYFPKEWRVTKETIEDEDNLIAKLWLSHFNLWAGQRVLTHYGNDIECDTQLEEVLKGLFPSVDPFTWGTILTFLWRPGGEGGRIKSLIENPRKFGLVGRVYIQDYEWDKEAKSFFEETKEERDNTIELALILFSGTFAKEKIKEYINEIDALDYKEEQNIESKNMIRNIFEDMLTRLNKEENK